jgi:hypothetical protein
MDSIRKLTGRSSVPPEVLVPIFVAVGGALVFVLVGLLRWQLDGDAGLVKFPIIVAVLELLVAGGLLAAVRPARLIGVVVFSLLALLHLLTVLNDGPIWIRVIFGVLSAAHVYGVVLLNTGPARTHLGGTA